MLAVRTSAQPVLSNRKKEEVFELPSGRNSDYSSLVPTSVQNKMYSLLVKPIEENLQKFFKKTEGLPGGEAHRENNLQLIKENRIRTETALDQMRQIEVQEGIASIGLKGFDARLNMEGIQIDLSSSNKKNEFFNLIREYVFLYPSNEQWPPKLEKGYEFFKYNSSRRQDCCFYWGLYGYIQKLFYDEQEKEFMDLTDLFVLKNIRMYCKDIFNPAKKERKKQNKPKYQNILKNIQKSNKNNTNNSNNNNSQNGGYCMFGGNNLPSLDDPEEELEKAKALIKGNREEKVKQRIERLPTPIAAFAFNCNPLKIEPVIKILKRTLVSWKVMKKDVQIPEFNAMENIVTHYVTNLKDSELLIEERDLNKLYFDTRRRNRYIPPSNYDDPDFLTDRDIPWSKRIIRNEPAIRDPLLGVTYTWGNLLDWFGYPVKFQKGKKGTSKVVDKNNPYRTAKHLLEEFRKNYTLNSAMFQIDDNTLTRVRRKFLKLLTVFFSQMRTMYIKIEKQVSNINNRSNKIRLTQSKGNVLLQKINQKIINENNDNKKEKLQNIKLELLKRIRRSG